MPLHWNFPVKFGRSLPVTHFNSPLTVSPFPLHVGLRLVLVLVWRTAGAEPHLVVYEQLGSFEVPGRHPDVVLLVGVVELSQPPVDQAQLGGQQLRLVPSVWSCFPLLIPVLAIPPIRPKMSYRVSANTQAYAPIGCHHMTHLLHRTSQILRGCAALLNGQRWEVHYKVTKVLLDIRNDLVLNLSS